MTPGLAGQRLVGDRDPSCLRALIVVDTSGSMRNSAVARDAAFARFLPWTKANLRSDDEVGVIDVAATAAVRLAPVPVPDVPDRVPPATGVPDGRDTLFRPLLAVVDALPPTPCETALLTLSDNQYADLPVDAAEGRALLRAHRVHALRSLVPGAGLAESAQWPVVFPESGPERFDGTDPDATGLAIGRSFASVTGQRLEAV